MGRKDDESRHDQIVFVDIFGKELGVSFGEDEAIIMQNLIQVEVTELGGKPVSSRGFFFFFWVLLFVFYDNCEFKCEGAL